MKITDYLTEDLIFIGIEPTDKPNLCAIIVDFLISRGKIPRGRREILIDKLLERESLSSTGVGGGVAIPHASGENIEKMIVAVGQAPGGVEYDAIDDEPVNLVFMIVGSERVPRVHLQLLATIVRACKSKELVAGLNNAKGPKEAYDLITEFDNK